MCIKFRRVGFKRSNEFSSKYRSRSRFSKNFRSSALVKRARDNMQLIIKLIQRM